MPLARADLDAHPLWNSVAIARAKLDLAMKNADAIEAGLIVDWHQALTFTERLKEIEAWRFPQSGQVLTSLASQIDALVTELQPVLDDPEASVATPIGARLDSFAAAASAAPVMAVTSGHLSGVVATVERLNTAVSAALEVIRGRAAEGTAELTLRLEELQAAVEAAKLDLAAQKTRVDTSVTDQTDRFQSNLNEWTEKVDAAVTSASREAEIARTEQSAEAAGLVFELRQLTEKSKDMVNVTARNTITTEYAQYARRQGVAATTWSTLAVSLAVGGLVAIFLIIKNVNDLTLAESVFKATLSTAVLGTAAFMGREAAGHRREARDAKRTQLDMNTLEPFLSSLPEEDAAQLRRSFAFRVFNRPLANQSRADLRSWMADASEQSSSSDTGPQ